jgi:branched-chain amino acid transport system substrate-binding protein
MKRFTMIMLAAAALAGCKTEPGGGSSSGGNGAASGDTVVIVSSLPRTGSAKGQTDTIVNGIKMAIEEAGGKAGPFKVAYRDWDDATAAAGQYTAVMEETNAKKAVADKDVMAYIGPFNSPAAAISMPITNQADLLMISPANTRPGLTKPGTGDPDEPQKYQPTGRKNYTRVVPADDLQGKVAAQWAQDMGVKKVYILDDGDVYGRGIALIFNDTCKDLGIEVLGHETIDPKQQEFRSLMTTIKSKNPDLVYFGGTTQSKGGQIAKDMAASGMTAKIMVPDGCLEQAFIEAATAENLNDRAFITFGGVPPDKQEGAGKAFVDKYQEKYGAMPEPYAIYGYEAAKVALKAIADAGKKDRRAVTDAAFAIRDFDGALGTWSFDENGDTDLTIMSGSTVKDGKFEFVKILGEQ